MDSENRNKSVAIIGAGAAGSITKFVPFLEVDSLFANRSNHSSSFPSREFL